MKLYSVLLSPNALRSRLVIAELGLPVEIVEVDMAAGENRSPEYLALNPNGKVPTLVDGDFVLWESRAINAYLAAQRPESDLYPADPKRRARVDQWSYWQAVHYGPALQAISFQRVLKKVFGMGDSDEAAIAGELKTKDQLLPVLDAALAGRDYVEGTLSIADIALAGTLAVHGPAGFGIDAYPNIATWYERLSSRPAWQQTLAPYYEALRGRGVAV